MKIAHVTCQAEIEVPEPTVQIKDHTGERVVGYRLSDGTELRPWITWELSRDDGESHVDLDEEELTELGFAGLEHTGTSIEESEVDER